MTPTARLFIALIFATLGPSALWTLAAETGFGQALTLRELARMQGGKGSLMSDVQMPFATLDVLTEGADVIVQGRIVKVEPRLSKDEMVVWTFVTLRSDLQMLKGVGGGGTQSRPAFTPELTFFVSGGTVREGGLEMTYRSNIDPDPPLKVGDEVIAFLTKSDEPQGWRVQYGPYGLLRVQGRHVTAANKDFARRNHLESDSLDELRRRVQEVVAARR